MARLKWRRMVWGVRDCLGADCDAQAPESEDYCAACRAKIRPCADCGVSEGTFHAETCRMRGLVDDPTYPPRYYVPGSIGVGNFPVHVEVEALATPKAKAEAKAEAILETLSATELDYLYLLLHDGRGLTVEGCTMRLRKAGWR